MNQDIKLQIECWEKKKTAYQAKRDTLERQTKEMEAKRTAMDREYAFKPKLRRFYSRLDSLYKQLHTISAKISKCDSHLSTLKICMAWS